MTNKTRAIAAVTAFAGACKARLPEAQHSQVDALLIKANNLPANWYDAGHHNGLSEFARGAMYTTEYTHNLAQVGQWIAKEINAA